MQYDPIKRGLGKVFNTTPLLRVVFYRLLDVLLLRTWHVRKELRKWQKSMQKGGNILDAGSGFGQYSYFLSRWGKKWNIDAVDVKEEQIQDCSNFFKKIGRNNVDFSVADLTTFNVPGRYNLILSVDVMEHILEDVAVFRNFYNALAPGGMLLISTPSDQGGSDVHDHEGESFIDEHVRDGYGYKEMEEKLASAGFKKAIIQYSYGWPGKLSWRLSMKYPILMLNASRLFYLVLPFYYLLTMPFVLILNSLDVNLKHKTGTGLIVKAFK